MNPSGHPFLRRLTIFTIASVFGVVFDSPCADAQNAPPQVQTLIRIPAEAQPIMPVGEVRIGMRGYGLTIFHGTKIEPFPVEVLSVVSDEGPNRAVIWIRCDEPSLNESGPIQGMSGSPIYLWEEGEEGTLGEGGRLIGAFAFGYTWPTNCTAGVQPIELMRDVGSRVDDKAEASVIGAPDGALAAIKSLQTVADRRELPGHQRYQLDVMARVMDRAIGSPKRINRSIEVENPTSFAPRFDAAPTGSFGVDSTASPDRAELNRMFVPLPVGDATSADLLTPLLAPMGLAPVATGTGTVGGPPPSGTDIQALIQPGSVLSIPLAYGDLDLSGAGTVTDVLPDGTILAFGHQMYSQGQTSLPLSTGYVHFVSSRKSTSFKVGGSLQIAGTISRDENSAVAGNSAMTFETADLNVAVAYADQPPKDYQYKIVDHPMLTAVATAYCAIQSVTAVRGLPLHNTMRLDTEMTFTGDRQLNVSTMVPMASGDEIAYTLAPAIAVAMQNPFESLKLESVSVRVNVEPTVRIASLLNVRLDKPVVEPGGTLSLTIEIQPFNEPVRIVRTELAVPADTPEGDYPLVIADAQSYLGQLFMTRSHLFQATDVDQLFDAMRRTYSVRNDALYVSLILTEKGIAIGREELPQLPSSRRAMILTPTSTAAMPYLETVDKAIPLDMVVQGAQDFYISVRKPHSEMPVQ